MRQHAPPNSEPPGPANAPTPQPQHIHAHRARHNLAELMERAHAGECFVFTKYGRPWARLMPLEPEPAPPAPQRRPGRLQWLGPLAEPRILLWP